MNPRSRLPRLLAGTPHLATLYIRCSNRNETAHTGFIVRVGLLCAAVATTSLTWTHRAFMAASFNELQQHTVMMAVLAGLMTAVVVFHQRSVHTARAARSWLAALPVSLRARRAEGLMLQLVPAIIMLALVCSFCLLTGAVLALGGLHAGPCVVACRSLLIGALLGAAVGLTVPLPKTIIPHPGSRYVPHRATRGRRPAPSMAALGIWPIRQMFAMLRPKALSRALMLVLLAVPMGSTAAAAIVWIGQLGALTAFVLLGVCVVSVTRAARYWLQPLPLSPRRLILSVAIRPLFVMMAIGAVTAWLFWVGRL